MNLLHRCFIPLVVVTTGAAFGSVAAQETPAAQISIELKKGFVIVAKGSVGTLKNLTFVIDTGTSRTIVSTRIASELHLNRAPYKLMIFDHDVDAQIVALPNLEFGPISAESLKVFMMDLSDVAQRFGIRADAVIGMDVLRRRSFTINYKLRQIDFGSGDLLRHSVQLKNTGEPYSVVEAQINGRVVSLMVDTGFDGLVLFSDLLPKENRQHLAEIERSASGAAGKVLLRQASPAQLKIADLRAYKVSPLVVDIGGRDLGAFEGILGARALRLSSVRFDYERNILSWE
jgi:predicted aspartyl protease